MKLTLINGSPKKGKSLTLGIARAFLKGMGTAPSEVIDLYAKDIRPCTGCLSCWFRTPGRCVQQDDAPAIYESILASDLVVWSMPVYVFGMPSQVIRLIERIMPHVGQRLVDDELGRQTHPGLGSGSGPRHVLIMSGALADPADDFGSAVTQFRRVFGSDVPSITCCESNLFFMGKDPKIAEMTSGFLETAEQAGRELASGGRVSESTLARLNAPMMPKSEYTALINGKVR